MCALRAVLRRVQSVFALILLHLWRGWVVFGAATVGLAIDGADADVSLPCGLRYAAYRRGVTMFARRLTRASATNAAADSADPAT